MPSSLRPVFGGAADADKDALFSEDAVRQALQGYVDREGLGTGASTTLKLDKCVRSLLVALLLQLLQSSERAPLLTLCVCSQHASMAAAHFRAVQREH